ncbi:conserved hypothetical protein [metagenome]|uniref:Peptidase C39-like domain-containing protein n=1 Tax=metagenome TaxID=256318 RepID=A0A2P2BYK2_9ZZZZ
MVLPRPPLNEVFPMPRAPRQRSGTPLPVKIAIGALAVLLVGAPFVPRGDDDDDGAVRPSASGEAPELDAATAGTSAITPVAQREIDRVVAQGATVGRTLTARATPALLAQTQVRCADFEGQRYCLHSGWTTDTPDEVVSGVIDAARQESARRTTNTVNTGDADLLTTLRRSAALSPAARAAADRAELTAAARSVAKVWLLRHQIQGVPLPEGFLEEHPEVTVPAAAKSTAGATASPTASPTAVTAPTDKTNQDYPQNKWILDYKKVAEQTVTYYCGPTSMQMIAWNWSGTRKSQSYWADRLGTTSNGSAISDLVRVTNASTGWDRKAYAGPYIVLDIKDFSYRQWMLLTMRHIVDYRAPLILHPILHKEFYPYLDDDASGHFQVGRGYNKRGDKANLVSYFEPWNQQRFDPSEPYIARLQNRSAYKSYRANLAHFQHNIGV